MVVVATRRSAQYDPRFAAILRAIDGDVRHVDDVRVLRIDRQLLEIPAASPQRRIVRHSAPRRARVVGAKESSLPRRWSRRSCTCRGWLRWRSPKGWLDLCRSL